MPPKKPSQVHFVTGSDDAGVKRAALELAGKLAPGADAFGMERIDGAVDTVDQAIQKIREARQALLTLPFLGGSKLVWFKSVTFLKDDTVGRSESVLSELESLVSVLKEGLPEGVQFLMSAPEPDKRRSAYKELTKLGNTVLVDKPKLGFNAGEGELADWTAGQLRARGLKVSHDAVDVLAARVGLDTGQLETEIEKLLTAFDQAHEITAADVRALVPPTRESGIFEIGTAIGSRDLPLALELLDQLLYQGESAIGILLASIAPTVRNLLYVKDLMERYRIPPPAYPNAFSSHLGRIPPSETVHLPRKKDGELNTYGLGVAAVGSVHYTLAELRAGVQACASANLQLVSTQLAPRLVLSRLLIGLMARRHEVAA